MQSGQWKAQSSKYFWSDNVYLHRQEKSWACIFYFFQQQYVNSSHAFECPMLGDLVSKETVCCVGGKVKC